MKITQVGKEAYRKGTSAVGRTQPNMVMIASCHRAKLTVSHDQAKAARGCVKMQKNSIR